MKLSTKLYILAILIIFPTFTRTHSQDQYRGEGFEVYEVANSIFTSDKLWRGADGAASIDLGNGRVLWLFSDTFIDADGTGKRSNSMMINNSIAIQQGYDLENSHMTFYYKGSQKEPKSFFELPIDTWFWTGHGIMVKDKLIVFLLEERKSKRGIGFEAIGWYVVIIDNPIDNPLNWKMEYIKGPETFGVIVGSSAVLKDDIYIYSYGVKEPATHEVYLLRFEIDKLMNNNINDIEWWVNDNWESGIDYEPKFSYLFIGQTEFSVHYQKDINKYVQIQTFGFGQASLGYRISDQLEGPWSEPVYFYEPHLQDQQDFVYSANAHPELTADGILITYNINNGDFGKLVNNENIYFPKFVQIIF
jgi:hypothetical protein